MALDNIYFTTDFWSLLKIAIVFTVCPNLSTFSMGIYTRKVFQEPYFPAWIFPPSPPLAEIAAEIQGILQTLIRFCLFVDKSIGKLFMVSNKWAALLCLRVDNYDFDLKLLRLHRVCLFNPKGALLTFDFPQIS